MIYWRRKEATSRRCGSGVDTELTSTWVGPGPYCDQMTTVTVVDSGRALAATGMHCMASTLAVVSSRMRLALHVHRTPHPHSPLGDGAVTETQSQIEGFKQPDP